MLERRPVGRLGRVGGGRREAIGKARVVGFLFVVVVVVLVRHRMRDGKRVRVRLRLRLRRRVTSGRLLLVLVQIDQGRTSLVVEEVVMVAVAGGVAVATAAVSAGFANNLEEGDGYQPPGTRDKRVAGFVPILVVLPADDVKEVSLAERQFLRVLRIGVVVVEGFDDLESIDISLMSTVTQKRG